jgi:uncharacterized protein
MSEGWEYHPGERAVQARAGVVARADRVARGITRDIQDVAAAFLAAQPMLVVGWADPGRRVWCSVAAGPPGFARATGPRTVTIAAQPPAGDPLSGLRDGDPVGLLAIEPATRRRMRLNGTAHTAPDGSLVVEADEVFSNCPKYITRRDVAPAASARAGLVAPRVAARDRLTPDQVAAITAADTFFLATAAPGRGVDASHRGGDPGFVTVTADRLAWADSPGNSMFLSLGNLAVDPAAGILVIDWSTGATLQLTGRAEVEWRGPGDRTVHFAVDEVRDMRPA